MTSCSPTPAPESRPALAGPPAPPGAPCSDTRSLQVSGRARRWQGSRCRIGPAAPAAETVTLKELQNGDAACYVIATKASGEEVNYAGSFELCQGGTADASALIGKPVKLTIGREKILAGSCQGDPECKDTEEVDFVTAVAASP